MLRLRSAVLFFSFAAVATLCSGQECEDFPDTAKGVTDENGTPLHLTQPPILIATPFDEHLYWVTDGVYQGMFMIGDSGVILIDAPPNFNQTTPDLVGVVASVTDKPITHLVYSHFHRDHIGAASEVVKAFPDVEIVANERTKELLEAAHKRNGDDSRPIPTVTFASDARIDIYGKLGERCKEPEGGCAMGLEMMSGEFHGDGDLFIMAPTQRVMYVVDLIFPGFSPFQRLAVTTDVGAFIEAHDTLLNYDFDHLVAGHLTRLGTKEDVRIQKEYVESIVKAAQQALSEIEFGPRRSDPCYLADPYNLILDFLAEVVDRCYELVVAEWKGKLGAVETLTRSHCDVIQTFLRLD